MPPRLRLSGIRKRFGATVALAGIDLDVAAGEIHALVGENGAGKSTLMKILCGVHPPDAGTMGLAGEPYTPTGPLDARRAGMVMVNQELAIAPDLTVAENIVLGCEPTRGLILHHGEVERIAREALASLGRADLPLCAPAGTLSVAEQQLVEIARALAVGCQVLVLDEPTSSLAHQEAQQLFTLVRKLRDQGKAIIYISHFLEEVMALGDRYTVLRDGVSVATGPIAAVDSQHLAQLMVGRQITKLYTRSPRVPGETLLTVEQLAGPTKPTSASLQLRRGEVLGIAGLMGSGRSELLRAIFALDPVRAGRIQVGTYAGPASPLLRWRQRMGLLSEDRKSEGLALNLSLEENLTLPGLPPFFQPSVLAQETRDWITRLQVRCAGPNQAIGELSGGNQQKIALGRLLRNRAEVLLLDEPTRGVDIGAKQTLYRLIDELAVAGKAVLVVSSHLPELLGICDRIAVMCRGVLGAAQPVEKWTEHEIMLAATGSDEPRSPLVHADAS